MLKHQLPLFLVLILFFITSCKREVKVLPPPPPKVISQDKPVKEQSDLDKEGDVRRGWQQPEKVISALGDIQEKVIADLGAGIGYFSFKLLPKCQKVIAIDIDKDITQILNGFKNTMNEDLQSKFDVRLATPSDSKLEANEVDIILIVNTITYIGEKVSYLENLKSHLKENGKVFIVDFKSKRLPDFVEAPEISDRVYMHQLEDNLEAAGYRNINTDDTTLDFQFIISATL